ncbi:MAG: hypothetical protein WCO66_00990 [Candidatus Absconditabacteria bacterium]
MKPQNLDQQPEEKQNLRQKFKKQKKVKNIPLDNLESEKEDLEADISELNDAITHNTSNISVLQAEIDTRNKEIKRLEKGFEYFPLEYKTYLSRKLKDIETQINQIEIMQNSIKEIYKVQYEAIKNVQDAIDSVQSERKKIDNQYEAQIKKLERRNTILNAWKDISENILAEKTKKSPEKLESIKNNTSLMAEDIIMRTLLLYISIHKKYDPKVISVVYALMIKNKTAAQNMIQKLIQYGYFIDFFNWMVQKDPIFSKEILGIWIASLEEPIEELVSVQTIENRIGIKDQKIVYDRIPDTHTLIKILYSLGILDEIKVLLKNQSSEMSETFKQRFGENAALYGGIKSIIQRTSTLYFEDIKRELESSIIQKKYR